MNKPKLMDYVEVPKSTTTETNYNYKRYSIALEDYIEHLESEVKKLNTPDVSVALPLQGNKDRLIKFFQMEYELGFCSKDYYERIKWYFEEYECELFNNYCAMGGNER
jgi:hypothetical protein